MKLRFYNANGAEIGPGRASVANYFVECVARAFQHADDRSRNDSLIQGLRGHPETAKYLNLMMLSLLYHAKDLDLFIILGKDFHVPGIARTVVENPTPEFRQFAEFSNKQAQTIRYHLR